jgi:predicted small integral membrane protein
MFTIQNLPFSLLQFLLAIVTSLGYMTTGLVRGFSSPGVPSMQEISPHLVPDDSAFSWISKYGIFTSHKFNRSRYEKEGFLILCLNIQHRIWMFKFHVLVEFWFCGLKEF